MTLTLAEANLIVSGAIERAQQLNLNVSVAVCKAPVYIGRLSIGKAIESAGSGLPSANVVVDVGHRPVDVAVGEQASVVCARGGLPILRAGKVEGACGVAGAPSYEQDEECARMGIANLGS